MNADSSDESVVDSDEADDSEDYSGEEEEEEEEGLSWDELEEQAKRSASARERPFLGPPAA